MKIIKKTKPVLRTPAPAPTKTIAKTTTNTLGIKSSVQVKKADFTAPPKEYKKFKNSNFSFTVNTNKHFSKDVDPARDAFVEKFDKVLQELGNALSNGLGITPDRPGLDTDKYARYSKNTSEKGTVYYEIPFINFVKDGKEHSWTPEYIESADFTSTIERGPEKGRIHAHCLFAVKHTTFIHLHKDNIRQYLHYLFSVYLPEVRNFDLTNFVVFSNMNNVQTYMDYINKGVNK